MKKQILLLVTMLLSIGCAYARIEFRMDSESIGSDASGFTKIVAPPVAAPAGIIINVDNITNVTKSNPFNGSVTVSATGGLPPYSYAWSTKPVQTNATATGLKAKAYTVTVTDACGHTKSLTVGLFRLITGVTPTTSKYCTDGTLTATLINFSLDSNPVFTLYNSNNTIVAMWNLITDSNASHTFTGLSAGYYNVIATVGNGTASKTSFLKKGPCTFSFNDVVIDPITKGWAGYGCESSIEIDLHYNGLACGLVGFTARHLDPNGEDAFSPFSQSGNDYSNSGFYELVSEGITIIGSNGVCIDSVRFQPGPLPCIEEIGNVSISYGSCGASFSASVIQSNFCNPIDYERIIGITNNYHGYSLYANGLPDGLYYALAGNGGCEATVGFSISGATFAAPDNLTAKQIGNLQDVRLKWSDPCYYDVYDMLGYQVQVKKAGDINWTTYNPPQYQMSKKITNVINDTTYYYRVRSKPYDGVNSLWSATESFCIGANCGSARIGNEIINANASFDFRVIPNPATDKIQLSFEDGAQFNGDVIIYDEMGKVVYIQQSVQILDGVTIDISTLVPGIYNISLINNIEQFRSKFIKMK